MTTFNYNHSLIIGGAGFIGSNLTRKLLQLGQKVTVVDNFSRGKIEYLDELIHNKNLNVLKYDISIREDCEKAFSVAIEFGHITEVWHLAANSDIPAGVQDPEVDLKDTFMTTFNILKLMKIKGVKSIHFASSSAIYGDFGETKIHEAIGPLLPISNYGAMKLASEAQIAAAAESLLEQVNIFRFPNVVGIPATHGVIFDFVNKLINDPNQLHVLGNGTQQKAYLHAADLIDAMLLIANNPLRKKIEVFNIGPVDNGVTVKWIAEQVVNRINPQAKILYGEGNKGWIGDVPKFNYSTDKLQALGWKPHLGSEAAITKAVDQIAHELGF